MVTHDHSRTRGQRRAFAAIGRICALGAAAAPWLWSGCAPENDPVGTVMPARSPEDAALRVLTVPADSVSYLEYDAFGDVSTSDRLVFGDFGGIRGRALVRWEFSEEALDTLADRTVTAVDLRYFCLPGASIDSTIVDIVTTGVQSGEAFAWTEGDTLMWPGPALDEATARTTSLIRSEERR